MAVVPDVGGKNMQTVIFDAYGTLFDWSGVAIAAQQTSATPELAQDIAQQWRKLHLELAWQSTLMERYQDFDRLAAQSLDIVLRQTLLPSDQQARLRESLLQAAMELAVYPDVIPTLSDLTARTAILSNGTLHALQKLADRAGILFSFDYILSVDPVRSYKPSRKAYAFAMGRLGAEKADITFVSSNAWDVAGAKAFGFRTCWCNREEKPFEALPYHPDITISDLRQLVEHV